MDRDATGAASRSEDRVPGAPLELRDGEALFVGFKMETSLRRRLESLTGPDRKYVSTEDSTYLRICTVGDDRYVGKVVRERLTTDRVDDVRRNVLSIVQRLCPDVRLPASLEIIACPKPPGGDES